MRVFKPTPPEPRVTVFSQSSRVLASKASADRFNDMWNNYDQFGGEMRMLVAGAAALAPQSRIPGAVLLGYQGAQAFLGGVEGLCGARLLSNDGRYKC